MAHRVEDARAEQSVIAGLRERERLNEVPSRTSPAAGCARCKGRIRAHRLAAPRVRIARVTIQVVPAVAVPSVAHGIELTDRAAYSETSVSGNVWTDEETRSSLGRVFDTLRSEAWRASESLALIEQAAELWIGESPLTAIATADRA
jgi:hypothetical protein